MIEELKEEMKNSLDEMEEKTVKNCEEINKLIKEYKEKTNKGEENYSRLEN